LILTSCGVYLIRLVTGLLSRLAAGFIESILAARLY
jgi:hypothetical protein